MYACLCIFYNVRHRPLDVQLFNAWSKRIGQKFICFFFFLFSNIFSNFYQRVHSYIHIYFYRVIYLCDIYHIYLIIIAYVYYIVYYNYLNSNRAHRRKYKALSNLFILFMHMCIIFPSFPFSILFPFKLLCCCLCYPQIIQLIAAVHTMCTRDMHNTILFNLDV